MNTPFDRALERQALTDAADAYALRHGVPGTGTYRAAWLRFVHRVRTREELRRWQRGGVATDPRVVSVLSAATDRAREIDAAPMGNAQLVDTDMQALRLVAHCGFSQAFVDFFEIVEDDCTACGVGLATGEPVWVSDVTASSIFSETPAVHAILDAGIRSVASLPVTSSSGQVMAMLSIHHKAPSVWTRDRKLALQHLAESAGRVLAAAFKN